MGGDMTICTRCVQLEAELEVARELAYEAVQARDIGRAALMLMDQQLAEWKTGVVAANRISQEMEARAVKAEAYLAEMTSAILGKAS
jgi:hypothetical protein